MTWPQVSLYDSLLERTAPGIGPGPGALPGPLPPGLPSPAPGSLSPVPAPPPQASGFPIPPDPGLMRKASPISRFEVPEVSADSSSIEEMVGHNPLKGIMPSEDVRTRRLGMMHAGAAMAAAADSGKGFAASITQGILAGNIAMEDARFRYAEMELKREIQREKRRKASSYVPDIESFTPEVLEREAATAARAGSMDVAKELSMMADRVARRSLSDEEVIWTQPGDDGVQRGGVLVNGEFQEIEDLVRRPNAEAPDQYVVRDPVKGMVTSVYTEGPNEGQSAWSFEIGKTGLADKRKTATLEGDQLLSFRNLVHNDPEFEKASDSLRNFEAGLGVRSIGNILDNTADALAAHAQLFAYINSLDDTAVREGEIRMMEKLGELFDLPKNWYEAQVEGLVSPEKVRRAIAVYTRIKGGKALDTAKDAVSFYKKTGSKYGLTDSDMDEAVGSSLMKMYAAAQRFDTELLNTYTEEERAELLALYRAEGMTGYGAMDWGATASGIGDIQTGETETEEIQTQETGEGGSFDDIWGSN